MSVTRHKVEGFDNIKNLITDLTGKKEDVYVLFSGSKDSSGKSWCPDCEKAEPVIEDFLSSSKFSKDFNFIHVEIDRTSWKDMENQYRTDPKFQLKSIPTLIKCGGPEKLGEAECADKKYLEMIFEESI